MILKAITIAKKNIKKVQWKLLKAIKIKKYSSPKANRSDSDNGMYIASIKKFIEKDKKFNNFKRDVSYRRVLEHVSKEQGEEYLKIAQAQAPEMFKVALESVLKNDSIGNPIKHYYSGFGMLSPTTLRYVKVATDIKNFFGEKELYNANIAEIGGGYGGQAIVLDTLFDLDQYTIYDLLLVNQLISKYLESFVMKGSYDTKTINQSKKEGYDLAISNYAFSELPKHLQKVYIDKILKHSKKGYLTMNSGKGGIRSEGKFTLEQLRDELPEFIIIEEKPLTSLDNYLIVWGLEI